LQEFIDFQDFPGPALIFQDFPVLENARIKFKDVKGFPGPVQTLQLKKYYAWSKGKFIASQISYLSANHI